MSDQYKFVIKDGQITEVYEYEHGRFKLERPDSNETWSLDGDAILKTEQEHGQLEVERYTDTNGDGIFNRVAKYYSQSSIDYQNSSRLDNNDRDDYLDGDREEEHGEDHHRFSGDHDDYEFYQTDNGLLITSTQSRSQTAIKNEARLTFDDCGLAFGQEAQAVARLIGVTFGHEEVDNDFYTAVGLSMLDAGSSLDDLAELAANAAGINQSNQDLVSNLWMNLFEVEGNANDLNPYVKLLDEGMARSTLILLAANTDLNADNIGLDAICRDGLQYQIGI